MNITIEINCETINELIGAFAELTREIKAKKKRENLTGNDDFKDCEFDSASFPGDFAVIIMRDEN